MKFSEKWLREWVDPDIDTETLAHGLTMAGHEVESVQQYGAGLDYVIVAEVLDVQKHPNADRLSVCQVNIGESTPLEVVCGAPNVAADQKVAVATETGTNGTSNFNASCAIAGAVMASRPKNGTAIPAFCF